VTVSAKPNAGCIGDTTTLSSALHGERLWRRVADRDYVTRDGRQTVLAVWETGCMICGTSFRVATPKIGRSKSLEVVTRERHRMTPAETGKLRFAKAGARRGIFEAIKREKLAAGNCAGRATKKRCAGQVL